MTKKKLLWNSRICNLHKARSMDFRFLQNMQFSNIFLFQTNIWIQKQVLVSEKNHIKTTACKVTISDSFIILPPCHSIYTRTLSCWRLFFIWFAEFSQGVLCAVWKEQHALYAKVITYISQVQYTITCYNDMGTLPTVSWK